MYLIHKFLQLICFTIIVSQTVECFSLANFTSGRIRRQASSKCGRGKFACGSGECVDEDAECDGAVDCLDASDESNSCERLKCPPFLYQCAYGACIERKYVCDGVSNCRDGSDENTGECKNGYADNCRDNEFRCSSGQCIPQDNKCDGKAECDDHSDEIRATCWNIKCPGFTHQCKYGACVNGDAQCNGVIDCYDGSDEDPAICRTNVTIITTTTPRSARRGECILPSHPDSGKWSLSVPGSYNPGTPVRSGVALKVLCQKQYKLDGDNIILCENGAWSSSIARCLKLCPPIESTPLMKVTCAYKDKEHENCTSAVNGTLARFQCANFYEDPRLKNFPIHICQDGTWDQERPRCTPVCGLKTVDSTTLIIKGNEVNKGDYPWQAALYTKHDKDLICGGSLINQRIILTAAHCVSDSDGVATSKEDYIIAVGKYYRTYNDSRDYNDAQFSELKELYISDKYQGEEQNHVGDIALLVTKKIFTLSRRVLPVCIDLGSNINFQNNALGYVTGWGFTKENSQPSDKLKELQLPSVPSSECKKGLNIDYHVYLTFDKMCAGYINQSSAVCRGDSGGGLVFRNDGRYYVQGVVSLSPTAPGQSGGCDKQNYGLFTKVSNYINEFIIPKLAKYKV